MKRRDWLRSAAATFGASLAISGRYPKASARQEPPDGPDDDYDPMPPVDPRIAPIATAGGGGPQTHAVALSADGARIASVEEGLKVFKVWDAADGRERLTSAEQIGPIQALAFAPDGMRIATAASKGSIGPGDDRDPTLIKILDVATGCESRDIHILQGRVIGLALTRAGTVVALDTADVVRAWNVANGAPAFLLKVPGTRVRVGRFPSVQSSFGVSAAGRRLASLSTDAGINGAEHPARTVYLWDADAGTHRILDAEAAPLRSVAVSPDGSRVLVATVDQEIMAFDFATGRRVFAFFPSRMGGGEGPYFLAFSPDGARFVIGKKDGVLRMYESQEGRFIDMTRGPRTFIRAVAFLPDRLRVVSGGIAEVGVKRWPNGAVTMKHEPLWIWDVPLIRYPNRNHDSFRRPGQ